MENITDSVGVASQGQVYWVDCLKSNSANIFNNFRPIEHPLLTASAPEEPRGGTNGDFPHLATLVVRSIGELVDPSEECQLKFRAKFEL